MNGREEAFLDQARRRPPIQSYRIQINRLRLCQSPSGLQESAMTNPEKQQVPIFDYSKLTIRNVNEVNATYSLVSIFAVRDLSSDILTIGN